MYEFGRYATVAASQTDQALGSGAKGDVIEFLTIVPATTAPGVVQIKDGGGSAITVYTGSATYGADLKPFTIELNAAATTGPWKITTGANVSVFVSGNW